MEITEVLNRPLEPELMDGPHLTLSEVESALADLDRVNQKLFGLRASCRSLIPRIANGPRCQTLVDLGTGSGKVSARLQQLAMRAGVHLQIIGVDRKLSHLLFGRRDGSTHFRVVADAEALPFRAGAVDWGFSNLLFHHFDRDENRRILREMARIARRGVAIIDLRRALCARALIRLLFPLLRVGPVATYDGKLSADQAWCLEQVRQLAAELPVDELRRRFPFRFSLILRPADPR